MDVLDTLAKAKVREAQRVKDLMFEAGLTFASVDRRFGLKNGTARDTLRHPNVAGERAIAAALGTRPHFLWLTRYRASGQRKPQQDYSRPPTMEQRRNAVAVQT